MTSSRVYPSVSVLGKVVIVKVDPRVSLQLSRDEAMAFADELTIQADRVPHARPAATA